MSGLNMNIYFWPIILTAHCARAMIKVIHESFAFVILKYNLIEEKKIRDSTVNVPIFIGVN